MSDVFILGVMCTIFVLGITRPHIAFMGYVWVDTVVPQTLVFGFLRGAPISMVMALFCFASLLFGFKKIRAPKHAFPVFVLVFLMFWITVTTNFAQFESMAWVKWDTVIKTMLMSLLLMFVINTKEQLEAALLVLMFSLSFFMLTAGIKTLFGGGGYGRTLIAGVGNKGMAESSTLAAFSVLVIPLLLFFKKNITLIPILRGKNYIWNAAIVSCVLANIGTTARTGLVTLAGFVAYRSLKWRYLFQGATLALLAYFAFNNFAPDDWKARMDTMFEIQDEGSAMGRVVVWQWTIDYVAERPFMGGGFQSFMANGGELYKYNSNFSFGVKAFHSIYFEVLGEQGYVGLIAYLSLIFWAYRKNKELENRTDLDEWHKELGKQMKAVLVIFCIGGAFVGIGYKPILFQFIALTVVHLKILEINKNAKERSRI